MDSRAVSGHLKRHRHSRYDALKLLNQINVLLLQLNSDQNRQILRIHVRYDTTNYTKRDTTENTMAWHITSSSTQEFKCDSCGDMILKGKDRRWNNITHKSMHRICYDSHILMTGTVSDDGPAVNEPSTHTTHNPAPTAPATPSRPSIPPTPKDASQPIPSPTSPTPVPSPVTPCPTDKRSSLGTDMMTQAVIQVVDVLMEDRIKALESELSKSQVTTIEHVITVPDIGTFKAPANAHPLLPEIMSDLFQGLIPWFQGPAGSGKTSLAQSLKDAMKVSRFIYMTFSEGSTKSEATGFRDMSSQYCESKLYDAVKNGDCICLVDEYDNTNGNLATVLNTGYANRLWDFPHEQVVQHETCYMVIATNTDCRGNDQLYPERAAMGAATIDRFVHYQIGYDEVKELQWALNNAPQAKHDLVREWVKIVQKIRASVASQNLQLAVTPRASIFGAKKIAAGFYDSKDWRTLASRVIFRGIDPTVSILLDSCFPSAASTQNRSAR